MKNKLNISIGNIALYQIIKDINPKDITTLNKLTCSTAKAIMEKRGMKNKKKIELATENSLEMLNSERN